MGSFLHSSVILIIAGIVFSVDCGRCGPSSQCLNGGSCTNGAYNNSLCLCLPEYTGERCELAVWPIWSDTPAVIVMRGEDAKLNCQYKTIPISDEYVVTWQYSQRDDINNILDKTMWTYSNSGEEISSDFNGKIRSNDTTNIRSKHTLYYLNVVEDSSVRCNVKISNNAFATIIIRIEVRNATGGADAFPVSSTMPSINAEVGSSADFRCDFGKVENLAGLSVTWYYGNVQFSTEKTIWRTLRGQEGSADPTNCGSLCEFVDTGAPLSNSHSIRIKDISLQREGFYMCVVTADNGKKQGNATTHLTVLVPPTPEVSLTPDDPYVGDTVTITCTAPAVKPDANVSMWLGVAGVKYNDTVNIEIEDKTSIVTLSTDVVVGEQHHGQSVMCGAVWRNMMYESDTQMLYVKYPPQSVTISTNSAFPVNESSLVTVTCTAVGGNPQPNLEIINKRNSIHQNLGYSPLSLTVNRTHHGSELQCNGSGGGIKSGFLLSNLINISVYYPASNVKIDGVTTDLRETDILDLSCSTEGGNPNDFTYRWSLMPRHGSANSDIIGNTAQLVVPNLNYTQVGQYTCQASNIAGAASTAKVVNIKFSPVVLEDGFMRLVHSDVNQEVDLIVPFLSYPPPTSVTWLTPSMTEITRTWEAIGQDRLRTVLTVNTANDTSFGRYNCTIRNSEGVLLASIELRKGRRPYPATNANSSKMTAYSMFLEWNAEANGGYLQTFKVTYKVNNMNKVYKEGISDPGEGKRVSLLITGLTPKTTYEFWIVGKNKINESEPLIHSVQTRGLPSTPEIRIIQTGNEAEISWETSGDYDTAVLVQCPVDTDVDSSTCTNHNVSGDASRYVVEADPAVTYTYRLELYQYDVKVASSENVRQEHGGNTAASTIPIESIAGGGAALIIIIIVVVVILVLVVKRRKSKPAEKQPINESPSTTTSGHGTDFAVYAGVDKPKNTSPKPRVIQEGDPLYDVGPAVPAKDPALQAEIQQGAAASNGVRSNGVAGDALNHENETTDNEKNKKKEKRGRKEKKEKKQKEVKAPAQYYNTKDPAPHKHDGGYSVVPAPSGEESAYAVAASGSVLPPRAPRHKQDGIYAEVAPSRPAGRGPRPIIGDPNKSDYGIVNFDRKQPIEDPNDSD